MQKKLLVAAVAGALVAPAAFAQSSVTISGLFKPSWARVSVSGGTPATVGNTSETLIRDNSSRIIFNVTEDLGSGLSAVAQLDNRFSVDAGAFAASGNVWAGLASKSWGQLTAGRHDLHYTTGAGGAHSKGDLALFNTTLLHVMPTGTATSAGNVAVGNNTRTTNSVEYKSPKWGIFSLIGAWSANGSAAEADLGSGVRKGNAWHIRPQVGMDNWSAEWSHWDQKPDAQAGGIDKIKGDTIAGKITFGAFGIGLAYDRSRITAPAGGGSIKRTAWTLPISWTSGPHGVAFDYTVARDSDATPGVNDGAKMWALAYAYSLSKRTAIALSYGKLDNKDGGTYTLFTGPAGVIPTGRDQSILSVVFNHTF